MAANDGEATFDALLLLGYSIAIDDSGAIIASLNEDVIHGQTTATSIEWRNPSAMYRVRERAYILLLRERIQQAQGAANRDPKIERPDQRHSGESN